MGLMNLGGVLFLCDFIILIASPPAVDFTTSLSLLCSTPQMFE
jgi:hypothetical protein